MPQPAVDSSHTPQPGLTLRELPLVDEGLAAFGFHNVLHALPERIGLPLVRGVEAGVRGRSTVCHAAHAEPEGDDGGDVGTHGLGTLGAVKYQQNLSESGGKGGRSESDEGSWLGNARARKIEAARLGRRTGTKKRRFRLGVYCKIKCFTPG